MKSLPVNKIQGYTYIFIVKDAPGNKIYLLLLSTSLGMSKNNL